MACWQMCEKDGYIPDKELAEKIMGIGLSGSLTAGGKKRGLIPDIGGY